MNTIFKFLALAAPACLLPATALAAVLVLAGVLAGVLAVVLWSFLRPWRPWPMWL